MKSLHIVVLTALAFIGAGMLIALITRAESAYITTCATIIGGAITWILRDLTTNTPKNGNGTGNQPGTKL